MRILKYLFLLFLLLSLAFVVFVATMPSTYTVRKSKNINASKEQIYSFTKDFKNWKYFNPWVNLDNDFSEKFLIKSKDSLPLYRWNQNGNNGTIFQEEVFKDSIKYLLAVDGDKQNATISFKPIKKSTNITWKITGYLSFKEKMLSVLYGGSQIYMGKYLENGLENLNNYLVNELNSFKITVNGFTTKKATNFIQQKDSTSITNFDIVSMQKINKLMNFVKQNDIKTIGKPFVMFYDWNTKENKTIFSICVPVEEEILTAEGSEISGGSFKNFLAVKTTITGDYSHKRKAWDKTFEFFTENKIYQDFSGIGKHLEIYTVNPSEEKKPSKWVTEIYVPVRVKAKPVAPRPISEEINTSTLEPSNNTQESSAP